MNKCTVHLLQMGLPADNVFKVGEGQERYPKSKLSLPYIVLSWDFLVSANPSFKMQIHSPNKASHSQLIVDDLNEIIILTSNRISQTEGTGVKES